MRRRRNMSPDEFAAWFWAKVTGPPDECWPWIGATHDKGYGNVGLHGAIVTTHRLAYKLAIGPIPKGMHVLHHCDNPACCNPGPGHLFLGTHQDNMRDKVAKGRQAKGDRHSSRTHPESVPRGVTHSSVVHPECVPRGEGHPHAILTERDVRDIRVAAEAGERRVIIAARYGVSHLTINDAVARRTWAHVK